MKTILEITRSKANANITSEFLHRGDNVARFRDSYANLIQKVRYGNKIVSIVVTTK